MVSTVKRERYRPADRQIETDRQTETDTDKLR